MPVEIVHLDHHGNGDPGNRRATGVRFGILPDTATGQRGVATMLVRNSHGQQGAWQFVDYQWRPTHEILSGLELDGQPVLTARDGVDRGVRLRDFEQDGFCELIDGNPSEQAVFSRSHEQRRWQLAPYRLPMNSTLVDASGRDAGLRFVDIDQDGS
ncbi:hypothetical protein OAS39_04325 [Pirellulales bacterium]|nr:hypothetical protein [Pirellulales bacterium]